MPDDNSRQFGTAAIKQIALTSVMLLVQILVFFACAGYISELRPWLYFLTAFVHYSVSTVVQYKLNPQLLAQRLKRRREGSKLWDEVVMRVSNLMMLIAIPAIAGLDSRFGWSDLAAHLAVAGLALIGVSTILLNWAMTVNPHFEPTVRIQRERGHKVIANGPYSIIRHPGYLAAILFALATPLLIGSAVAYIPAGVYILLMIVRTGLEDRTLQEELNGYSEYASQVRHRLLPGIW